jgi:hypothetical protein
MKEEIKEKKCFKCELILPISDFYKHKKMQDGHLNKCKTCTKNGVKIRESELRLDNNWLMAERKRCRDKYHRLDYKGLYKPNTKRKREIIKRHQQKYPEKALATKYTEIYLTKVDGKHLHHWSYNQEDWLDIIELTIKEHGFLHRYIIYDQERMMYRGLNNILLDSKEKHFDYFNKCKLKYEY